MNSSTPLVVALSPQMDTGYCVLIVLFCFMCHPMIVLLLPVSQLKTVSVVKHYSRAATFHNHVANIGIICIGLVSTNSLTTQNN